MNTETTGPRSRLLSGMIIGAALGAVASLLFAPKKGAELRKELADTCLTFRDHAVQLASTVKEKTENMAQSTYTHSRELADEAREAGQQIADTAVKLKDETLERANREFTTESL